MIDVTTSTVRNSSGKWYELWLNGKFIARGRSLESVLIDAEKALRTDLDDLQGRLHAERERLKAEKTGVSR